jgi:hypothetical protein
MATIQYARLYPDTTQLQAKDGHNLTAGWVEVYLAGTDDPATTYADFNGTVNPQKIIVDDNGRFCAIVDKSKAYRVEVYDADGMLQWTTEPVWCTGNAGAGMSVTRVISTDGSIAVEENVDGSERTYDLSIAPSDSDEFLEWIKCSEEDCGSTWYPVYQAGTMETEAGQGIKVHAGQLYHFTNTFYVDPNGTGINYDTFKVRMYCNDAIVDERDFDIDSSLTDVVMCEFSTDLIPEADGVVYYKLTIPSTCDVSAEVQCHRIYSGINAVPDTCATKQWVQETFDYNLSGKVDYSAIEYNQDNEITGISGSAIAAASIDSAFVSGVASAYAESAISSISGWSGDFSSISSKIDWSSSGIFQPSGSYVSSTDMSAYVPFSGLEGEGGKVTGISGSAFKGHEYTGISPVVVDNTADTIAVEHRTLCVDSTMTAYNSGSSAVIGVNVAGLDLSSKMDASASSLFYSTSNPSSFITGVDLTPYQLTADMSAYAHESSLSSKLDASASSNFMSTSERADYLPSSASADLFTGVHTDSSLTGNGLSSSPLGVERVDVKFVSGIATGLSGNSVVVSADANYFSGYATTSYVDASVSSKLDASASGEFYPSSNPSGFLTAHQSLAGYATEAYVDSSVSSKLDTTAFSTVSGDFLTSHQSLAGYATESYVDSAVSGKLDVTASSQFLTSLPDDLAYTSDVASAVSGKMDKSESSSFYPMDSNPSGYLTAHQSLAGYATETYVDSAVSGKLDATAYDSAEFYTTSNPSGFIDAASASAIASAYQVVSSIGTSQNGQTSIVTSINSQKISAAYADMANKAFKDGTGRTISALPDSASVSAIASSYAESAVSGKQDASAMTAYQPAGDYQPSGDYIYVSALGWAEV